MSPPTISVTSLPYLSTLAVAGCEVIVVDGSPSPIFESNRARPSLGGAPRRRASAASHVRRRNRRRSRGGRRQRLRKDHRRRRERPLPRRRDRRASASCSTLHEVVEPQDYFEPLPWWGGIEAGRMLVHRGVEPLPDHGATFGFRKSSVRGLRGVDIAWSNGDDPVRRLASQGAEVFSACDVFVRRCRRRSTHWLRDRPRQADDDFAMPVKTAFFFALLPMAMLLATVRRLPPRRRLRGRDRIRVDRPRGARPQRRVVVLPAARMSLRAAVGARTIRQRLLGALPKTARLVDRRGTSSRRRGSAATKVASNQ